MRKPDILDPIMSIQIEENIDVLYHPQTLVTEFGLSVRQRGFTQENAVFWIQITSDAKLLVPNWGI